MTQEATTDRDCIADLIHKLGVGEGDDLHEQLCNAAMNRIGETIYELPLAVLAQVVEIVDGHRIESEAVMTAAA